ncbi:hypothetical protein GCM10011495_33930 [Hymenobacter frigidus]|uniref:Uncharacterized protein n=1 Tax=Hymenobacter frigidus TaxID=1524095 RepID=A0ABQ2AEM0_9BACT|nr:hypothetical protein GCM10011495_33930 [Hymenobacter frigidus]
MVNVNTRIAQVLNRLPLLVQRGGVIVNRVVPNMLMYVNLYSKDKNTDMKYLSNFSGVNMMPELQRLNGIGRASILGSR